MLCPMTISCCSFICLVVSSPKIAAYVDDFCSECKLFSWLKKRLPRFSGYPACYMQKASTELPGWHSCLYTNNNSQMLFAVIRVSPRTNLCSPVLLYLPWVVWWGTTHWNEGSSHRTICLTVSPMIFPNGETYWKSLPRSPKWWHILLSLRGYLLM